MLGIDDERGREPLPNRGRTLASRHSDRSRRALGAALALALAFCGRAALAQDAAPRLQAYTPPKFDPNYVAPRIGDAYAQKLARLPDMTGSWFVMGGYLFDPTNAWLPPSDDEAFDTGPPEGSLVKGIPYKPEYQKQYDATVARAAQGQSTDPVGACHQPHGMPRSIGGVPGGPEIIVLPDQVRMTYYWFNGTRRIYTDGRAHPAGASLVYSFMGHSIGHWEGDTLVVDTIGMDAGYYDRTGAPHSDQVHLTERLRLVGPDLLEHQAVVEDPVMLTRPWKVTRYLRRISHVAQMEGAYCEGGRIEMVDGVQHLVLDDDAASPPSPAAKH